MTDYAIPGDDPSLFPDEGYAIVAMDTMKPPDSDDFIYILSEFEDSDFKLPPGQTGYTYFVHSDDGEVFTRDDWPPNSEK